MVRVENSRRVAGLGHSYRGKFAKNPGIPAEDLPGIRFPAFSAVWTSGFKKFEVFGPF
jgi:hypothetical protein